MSILVDRATRVLVQGITGRFAQVETRLMVEYGTQVVAGVVPGRGGEQVHGVPVYDSVRSAQRAHQADASVIYVPAPFVKEAVLEAIDGGIRLICIATERISYHDTAEFLAAARDAGVRIVGPNSQGITSPGKAKIGGAGGERFDRMYKPGPVGIVSRSGGMASEIAWLLTRAGIGQSTQVHIGGEPMVGTGYRELLELYERDPETEVVVLFGEPGTRYEEDAAVFLKAGGYPKPLLACVPGRFASRLPRGVRLGHSSTMVEAGSGTAEEKVARFREAGAHVVESPSEIPEAVARLLVRG